MANATSPPSAQDIPEVVSHAINPPVVAATARETVLIIEPNFTGHRWRYAQWAADAYTEAGYRCLIVTESCNEDHRLARKILAARRSDLEIAFVDPPEPQRGALSYFGRIQYVRYHRYFRHAYRLVSAFSPPALVVVPYVDYFLYALPLLGSPFGETPWIGITMRATFHHRKVGVRAPDHRITNAVKSLLFRQAVRAEGMRALLSIDPTLPEWSARALGQRAAAIRYLADPFPDARANDPQRARERLALSPGPHLLVYGSITERKGIRELMAALEQIGDKARGGHPEAGHPGDGPTLTPTLVVAGEQDAATREFLRLHAQRLNPAPVLLDLFVTNEMELDLFSACDAVWLGYKGHYGMSGVLVQAYRFNKPVIATADGLIGWFCRGGELGPVIDDLSPEAIARAIETVFASERPRSKDSAVPTVSEAPAQETSHERLLERNTLEQFKRTLQEAMG